MIELINSIISGIFGGTIVYFLVNSGDDFQKIDNNKLKGLYEDYFDPDAILIN